MTEQQRSYMEAAERGDGNACFSLGVMYATGNGVQADATRAFEWYLKGAQLGHSSCKINVSSMYINGNGTKSDMSLGLKYALEASREEPIAEYAAVASMNAALVYRVSKEHRDLERSVEYCERAISQDPNSDDAFEQLCICAIYAGCNDMVAPEFVTYDGEFKEGYLPTERIGRALKAYHARIGERAYTSLAVFFRGESHRVVEAYKDRELTIAAQLFYLANKGKKPNYADRSTQYDLFERAQLYLKTGFPGEGYAQDMMAALAREGFDYAYQYIAEHNELYYEKKHGAAMHDARYKAELVGLPAPGKTAEAEIGECERASTKDERKIDRYAFLVAVGAEKSIAFCNLKDDTPRKIERARAYYRKMETFDPFVTFSSARLAETEIRYVMQKDASDAKQYAPQLNRAVSLYSSLAFSRLPKAEYESAASVMRLLELTEAKSACEHPSLLPGRLMCETKEELERAILPFEPGSADLLSTPVVTSSYGLSYSWDRGELQRKLYKCRHFEFLSRMTTDYPSELLSELKIDPPLILHLAQAVAGKVSERSADRMMLYAYHLGAGLKREQAECAQRECVRILSEGENPAAEYEHYRLYSGQSKLKRDEVRGFASLVKAAKAGCADACYEAALLAKKGKLASYGIGKSEWENYLRAAADAGHTAAKKKLR